MRKWMYVFGGNRLVMLNDLGLSMVTIGHLLAIGRLCRKTIGRLSAGILTVLDGAVLSVSLCALACLMGVVFESCRLIWPDRMAIAYARARNVDRLVVAN